MPERWIQEVALPRMTVNEAYLLLGKTLLPGDLRAAVAEYREGKR